MTPPGRPAGPDREWDLLATALNRYGVTHVAPARWRTTGGPRTAQALFERLALATEPRLRQAAIFLLLTHPALAADAQRAIANLGGTARDRAPCGHVAAAALQRMARTRLEQQVGPQRLIPPAFLDELRLPPLEEAFGQATLWELARQEEERYGYDAWKTYRTLLHLFLAETRRRGWGRPHAAAS